MNPVRQAWQIGNDEKNSKDSSEPREDGGGFVFLDFTEEKIGGRPRLRLYANGYRCLRIDRYSPLVSIAWLELQNQQFRCVVHFPVKKPARLLQISGKFFDGLIPFSAIFA